MITEARSHADGDTRDRRVLANVVLLGARDLSSGLARCLTASGFTVEFVLLPHAGDLDMAGAVDILVVDACSARNDELSSVKAIRASGENLPIIVISALHSPADRARALEAGADSYFTKPCSTLVLTAQINAHVRRWRTFRARANRTPPTPPYPFRVDLGKRLVKNERAEVHLTSREAALLRVLARRPGAYVTTSQLHVAVWGARYTLGVVPTCVSELRRRLAKVGAEGLIESKRGFGYRLSRREPSSGAA